MEKNSRIEEKNVLFNVIVIKIKELNGNKTLVRRVNNSCYNNLQLSSLGYSSFWFVWFFTF